MRAPPVAEEASKKEWQRSKFCERLRAKNFGYRNRSCHGFAVTEGSSGVDRHRLRRTGRGRALSRPVLGFWMLRQPRRGGPMCPPANGSRKEPRPGRHIGRPLQNLYQLLENRAGTEPCPCLNTGNLPQRASGRCPLRPGRGPEHGSHPVPDPHRRIMSHLQKEEAEYRLLFPYSVSWGGSAGAGFPPSAVLRPLAANRRFVPWPMSW